MNENPANFLVIINDGPYGSERAYNALRLALNLVERLQVAVRLFLIGVMVSVVRIGDKGHRTDTTTLSG